MEVTERARRYLAKLDGAVAGSGGHDATFKAACALVKGFCLDEQTALALLREDFNPRCDPKWSERELQHKVRSAAKAAGDTGYLLKGQKSAPGGGPVAPSRAKDGQAVSRLQKYDPHLLSARLLGEVASEALWLMERSPVDVRTVRGAGDFFDALYNDGERLLVFTSDRSQGDFGWWVGKGGFRMGARPGVKAERAVLPGSAQLGVWYLAQPVDFEWKPNGSVDKKGQPLLSRRSGPNVTAWRYMVLESDELDPITWLNQLAKLPMAVEAIYTSGGRSIHALVRVDCRSYSHFSSVGRKVAPLMAKLGGDPRAISGVRLTRLPFCMREGTMKGDNYQKYRNPRLQRLLYLAPGAELEPLMMRKKQRRVKLDE